MTIPSLPSIPAAPSLPNIPGFPQLPQVPKASSLLSMIGGSAIKQMKTIIHENRKDVGAIKFPPKVGDILPKLLTDGLGSMFQNPMAGALGQATSAIGSASSAFSAVAGSITNGSALTSALSGLTGSMSSLTGMTNAMAGVSLPGEGQFGMQDLLAHADVATSLGSLLPSGLGLDGALQPLQLAPQVTQIAADVPQVINGVIAGTIPALDAASYITSLTNGIDSVMASSTNVVSTMQNVTASLSVASDAIDIVTNNSGSPDSKALVESFMNPDALDQIKASNFA